MPRTLKEHDANKDVVFFMKRRLLMAMGLPVAKTTIEQLDVMLDALRVFADRTAAYGEQWVESGALDNFGNARRKVRREMHLCSSESAMAALGKDGADDALDAINYLVFGVRNLRNANIDGQEDEDKWEWKGVWHVRHADGTTEDIVLEHGNMVEDESGSVGQFILSRRED